MKKLLALAFVALMAGAVAAQTPGMGMFFSNTDFVDAETNIDTSAAPFDAYVVLIDSPWPTIAAYEVGIAFDDATVFVLSASGPNGWQNFGSNTDHQVGYTSPLPVGGNNAVVLSTLSVLYGGGALVNVTFGQSSLMSIPSWDGPVISNGANPTMLMGCYATGGDTPGLVATLNGAGIVANEARSLTDVKALFN